MFEVLDRVREKPKGERQAIALGVSVVITGVIFIVWAVSFLVFIKEEQDTTASSEESFGIGEIVNSLQGASNKIQQEVGNAREQFKYINNELQKTGTDTEQDTIEDAMDPVSPAIKEPEITPSGVEIIQI